MMSLIMKFSRVTNLLFFYSIFFQFFFYIYKDGYLIQLDGKTIRTPLRHKLCIPQHELALGVANEWHMQSNEINPFSMPLVTD